MKPAPKPQLEPTPKPRVYHFGNTTVKIHSQLAWMTEDEQRDWYKKEWKKGNPVLHNIAQVLFE